MTAILTRCIRKLFRYRKMVINFAMFPRYVGFDHTADGAEFPGY
jgi:hypothetical protein